VGWLVELVEVDVDVDDDVREERPGVKHSSIL
jgi:hypothetical protein